MATTHNTPRGITIHILTYALWLFPCTMLHAVNPQCLVTATSSESFVYTPQGNSLSFGNIISDTDNIHGPDNRTFTIHTPGIYSIATFMSPSATNFDLFLGIKVNDTYYPAMIQVAAPTCHLSTSAMVKLSTGDTIKIIINPDVAVSTYFGSDGPCRLSIVRVGGETTPQCIATATSSESFGYLPQGNSLSFGNIISDTDNIHGPDNRTFTIHTPGVYSIAAFMSPSATNFDLFLGIKVNDTYYPAMIQEAAPTCHLSTSAMVKLNIGDTIKIIINPDVAVSTYFGSDGPCRISIVKICD